MTDAVEHQDGPETEQENETHSPQGAPATPAPHDSVIWTQLTTAGTEGAPIALGALTGSWSTLTIGGIPVGAVLSDGNGHSFTATGGAGAVNVTGWSLAKLTITPASDKNFTLTATTGAGKAAQEAVVVLPLAPTLTWAPSVTGVEGQAIALGALTATVNKLQLDGSGNKLGAVILGGIPAGAKLSDGKGHSFVASAGSNAVDISKWSLSSLSIVTTNDQNFTLTVTATETDAQGDASKTIATEAVVVTPLAPIVAWATTPASGFVAVPVQLGAITAGVGKLAGDGTLNSLTSLVVAGVPEGATLQDGHGHSFTAAPGADTVNVLGWSLTTLTLQSPVAGSFTLNVTAIESDAEGNTSTASAIEMVTVAPSTLIDHPPVVSAGTPSAVLVEAGTAIAGTASSVVQLSKSDPDGPVSYDTTGWTQIGTGVFSKAGQYGAAVLDANANTLTYNLDNTSAQTNALSAGQIVAENFTVAVQEANGPLTASTQVAFTITGTNDAAILSAASVNLVEANTAAAISTSGVLSITDVDSPALFVAQTNVAGQYGAFSINTAGQWTYAASSAHDEFVAGTTYTDSFAVVSADGTATSVSVNILGTNDAAVLSTADVMLTEGDTATALSTFGTLSITDVDSPALFVTQSNVAGQYGAFSVDTAGNWSYTASSAHNEFVDGTAYTDSFAVTSADGTTTSVRINILGTNDAAILSSADVVLTEGNTAAALSTSGTLTISDVDSPALFVTQTDVVGQYGSFSIDASGSWTYTASSAHDEFAVGTTYTDSFAVMSADGTATSVTVEMLGTNDAPVFTTSVADIYALTGALAAADAEGDALSYSLAPGQAGTGAFGTLNVDPSGSWYYAMTPDATSTLARGSEVTDRFVMQVDDGNGGIDTQYVTVTLPADNAPPEFASAPVDLTLNDTSVLDNFPVLASMLSATDPNGDALTFSLADSTGGVGAYGSFTVGVDGSWTYTPDSLSINAMPVGWSATDTFVVQVDDGQGGIATQSLTFNVIGTNDAPIITSDAQASLLMGTLLATDVEGDALSFALAPGQAAGGAYGSLTINPATGDWSFTPDVVALGALPDGTAVADTFIVQVDDGNGGIATQTLVVNMVSQSNAPIINSLPIAEVINDTSAADYFGTLSGVLTAYDINADPITFQVVGTGTGGYGSMSVDVSGFWTYTPDNAAINALQEGQVVVDSFTVLADNGLGGTTTQAMTVTLTGANDAPVFGYNNSVDVYSNTTLVTALATDPDGQASLTYVLSGADAALFDVVNNQLVFKVAPDVAAGPAGYSVDVTASDGQLSATQSYFVNLVATTTGPFTVIDPTQTAANAGAITNAILGTTPGITADAASLSVVAGSSSAMFYDGSLSGLGIGAGILITSGTMPNTNNTVGYFGQDNGMVGNPALDAVVRSVYPTTPGLPGAISYDATSITFNFTVTDPTITGISLNAVFGSDEYPEWVDQYVDIGAVLVNGTNVAYFNNNPLAPLSVIGSNLAANYFIDNTANLSQPLVNGVAPPSLLPIEYDGVSHPLTIYAQVHQGVNTIEVAIADTGDHVYDSGLFISNIKATNAPTSGVVLDNTGTNGNDILTGTNASESFDAKAGNDVIYAGGGNDVVMGGAGNDIAYGGDGNDFLDGGSGTNILNGEAGDDVIQHTSGLGVDTINGGNGLNTLILNNTADTVGAAIDMSNPAGLQMLADGSSFVNMQTLSFHGGAGDDVVTGGTGADMLDGGAGNDTLTGGAGDDTLVGGAGVDTAMFSGGLSDYAITTIGTDLYKVVDLRGGSPDGTDQLSGIENVHFSNGTFAINNLPALGVTINGTGNDDWINPTQTVAGQPAVTNNGDTIYGGGGDDHVVGGAGADILYGGAGNDFINGGAGNDTIYGGLGNDELTGGLGSDKFVFLTPQDSPLSKLDVILDFSQAQGDKIDLTAMGNFSIVSNFTGLAGQMTIAVSGDGYLVRADTTGTGFANFALQVDTSAQLTMVDFIH